MWLKSALRSCAGKVQKGSEGLKIWPARFQSRPECASGISPDALRRQAQDRFKTVALGYGSSSPPRPGRDKTMKRNGSPPSVRTRRQCKDSVCGFLRYESQMVLRITQRIRGGRAFPAATARNGPISRSYTIRMPTPFRHQITNRRKTAVPKPHARKTGRLRAASQNLDGLDKSRTARDRFRRNPPEASPLGPTRLSPASQWATRATRTPSNDTPQTHISAHFDWPQNQRPLLS